MTDLSTKSIKASSLFLTLICLVLTGCPLKESTTFDEDGLLEANIRRTDFGVPHIKANNLESVAFGIGYAYSEDNYCMLMDIITRYNSERSQHFGPDKVPGSGDSLNLITDFGYLALGIREQAIMGYDGLSDETKAMLSGYTKGANHYLASTGTEQLDPNCANGPWVKPIDHIDMLTALLGTALLPGSGQFLAPIFLAAPPGMPFAPTPIVANNQKAPKALDHHIAFDLPTRETTGPASNAWAIGKDKSESGMGLLLANPHFPHTGLLRFWQFHSTVPGVMDVMGASLSGTPGIVNIGFNKNIAWTHTFSTAEHFIVYELALDQSDATGLSYVKDGQTHSITEKQLTIQVAVAPGVTLPFSKKVYFSDFGPVIVIPEALTWGTDSQGRQVAYAIKDVNKENFDIVDHWLAMNSARNMDEFKQAFKQFDGVLFNNTVAVDKKGNTFYIDDSTVPHLSDIAETALRTDPVLLQTRELLGFSVLPGTSSVFDFGGPVPYEKAPKLENTTTTQNSNDSYWLTNLNNPLPDYSILYGKTNNPQSLRSRMAQTMLQESSGSDELFNAMELEQALFNERAFLPEAILDSLIEICSARGSTPVAIEIPSEGETPEAISINIEPGCVALQNWDGRFYKSSQSAHVFREFAEQFALDPQWITPFDINDPIGTPNGLQNNDTTLKQFATALYILEQANIDLDATLGEVQFVEFTNPDGTPTGERFPWEGANNIEGGFNVFDQKFVEDQSLIARHQYAPLEGSQISAEGQGYQISRGTSWIMLVNYTKQGPEAKGLMTYSQSIDSRSPHRADQTRLYSNGPELRPIYFKEKDIRKHTQSEITISMETN